jgi:hypothetical protein
VSSSDGTTLILGKVYHFEQMEQIGQWIEKATARYLYPTALNQYQMGQPVLFGPLTITPEGLSHQSHLLPLERGEVYQDGGWNNRDQKAREMGCLGIGQARGCAK